MLGRACAAYWGLTGDCGVIEGLWGYWGIGGVVGGLEGLLGFEWCGTKCRVFCVHVAPLRAHGLRPKKSEP